MEIPEQAIESVKKAGSSKPGSTFFQKIKLFAWETGLGPVINVKPEVFGEQAVIYFPGKSGSLSFPCYENDGKILLALTEEELRGIREILIQNPAAELWTRNGWFTATVRLLTPEEKAQVEETVPDDRFFGNLLRNFIKPTLKDHCLLEAVRSAPCTGKSGPGSKAWVWPLAAILLLFTKKRK